MDRKMINDNFDEYRNEMGDEVVDDFLAKFGLGPNYKPRPTITYMCPACNSQNAYHKEVGADCDGGQNAIVLYCPDCRSESEGEAHGQ